MSNRADRLVALLGDADIDALLVTNLVNVRYLTGYSGTNGLAVTGPATRTFVTDFRYVEQAAEEVYPDYERLRASEDLLTQVADVLPPGDVRLGFEEAHVSVRTHARLQQMLPDRVQLVGVSGLVERLRAVKEPEEVELIRAASAIADEAFERLLADGLIGRTEREVVLSLETTMRELGAQRPSFDSIVAAGAHGALPHAKARDVAIEAGQLVVIDWGAEVNGYCSDCTRTVAAGELDDQSKEVYALVRAAQLAGVEAVQPGGGGRDIDGVARGVIERGGYGEHFGHGSGHGVGMEVHEAPRLSQRSEDHLQVGNVVTVEPGVYLPGVLGVRVEDLAVVTEQGCDILTLVSKELRTVD
jgi:Xaa-Pro aminopeptidase